MMNIEKSIQRLKRGLIVNNNVAKAICIAAIGILAAEDQVLRITPPVALCGDIMGNFITY